MKLLKHYIKNIIDISEDELNKFCGFFSEKQVKREGYLLKQGEYCDFEAFITKGLMQLIYHQENGKSFTLYFAVEGMWVTDLESYMYNIPSQFSIQAIEDTELLLIAKEAKEKCYASMHNIDKLFRIMSQLSLINGKNMYISSISKTAEERYIDFMENSPAAKRLTNIQIATYLGISREFVSKIRKKIVEK